MKYNYWCGLLFTVQPVLLHLFSPFTLVGSSFFWSLKRGDCSISQLKNWLCQKSEKANITCDMRFFPCCVAIFRLRKYISLTHSLPKNVGVWTRSHIKKKCFLPFQHFHTILRRNYCPFRCEIFFFSSRSLKTREK